MNFAHIDKMVLDRITRERGIGWVINLLSDYAHEKAADEWERDDFVIELMIKWEDVEKRLSQLGSELAKPQLRRSLFDRACRLEATSR